MKRFCYLVLIGLALVLKSMSAGAMYVQIVEDSPDRLVFNVAWWMDPGGLLGGVDGGGYGGGSIVASDETQSYMVQVSVSGGFRIGTVHDFFLIHFGDPMRYLKYSTIEGFSGSQILPLVSNPFAARVVYGVPLLDNPIGVPDGGQMGALLAGVLYSLARFRRGVDLIG